MKSSRKFVASSNFQIEYWTEEDPDNSFAVSDRINRHRTSHDITIKPCRCDILNILRMITVKIFRNYLFKIIASEDWRGVRQDYSVGSDTVKFRSVAWQGQCCGRSVLSQLDTRY